MSIATNLAALAKRLTAAATGLVTGVTPPAQDNSTALATTEWFKAEQAGETSQGTAKVATQAQTNAGTDDTRFVTPKKLRAGFAISLGVIGYIAFPTWLGGLIIQWGVLSDTSWTAGVFRTINYPVAFPAACLEHTAVIANSAGTMGYLNTNQVSASQLQMLVSYTGAATVRWIAVGY